MTPETEKSTALQNAVFLYLCRHCGWIGTDSPPCCPACSAGVVCFSHSRQFDIETFVRQIANLTKNGEMMPASESEDETYEFQMSFEDAFDTLHRLIDHARELLPLTPERPATPPPTPLTDPPPRPVYRCNACRWTGTRYKMDEDGFCMCPVCGLGPIVDAPPSPHGTLTPFIERAQELMMNVSTVIQNASEPFTLDALCTLLEHAEASVTNLNAAINLTIDASQDPL
jgi:rubrerythrin